MGEGWPAGGSLSTRVQMAGAGSACVFEGGRQVTCLQLADVLQVVDVEEDRDARHVKQHLVRVRVSVRVQVMGRGRGRGRVAFGLGLGLGLGLRLRYLPLDGCALVLPCAPDVREEEVPLLPLVERDVRRMLGRKLVRGRLRVRVG